MNREPLPKYDNPPVVEVVFGVQFTPIGKLDPAHVGLLWQEKFRDRFGQTEEHPVLLPQVEGADGPFSAGTPAVATPATTGASRTWFVAEDTSVIQVQRDRLLYNWRRAGPEARYPGYVEVREQFWKAMGDFAGFLQQHALGQMAHRQYELTYVSHLAHSVKDRPRHIGDVFPDLAWRGGDRFLDAPEAASWAASFAAGGDPMRLYVSLGSARHLETKEDILRLDISARGMPPSDSDIGPQAWFDRAHEWIVRSFADLTHEELQRDEWLRRDAHDE